MINSESPTTLNEAYSYSEENFDGFNSAPLLIVGNTAKRKLIYSQDAIASNFTLLAESELNKYTKQPVVDFVSRSIVSRMHQREGLNGNSYLQRLNAHADYSRFPDISPEDVDDACHNAQYGTGTVIQNEIAREAFSMNSVEYANLTIIGESRKQLEPVMWERVSELVGRDAAPCAGQIYGLQLLDFDRDIRTSSHIGAMRIGMKRFLGETKYGANVKARTTAIINLSPSTGVDPLLIEKFRTTARAGRDIAELPEFMKAVRWLVETELPPGLVLARNETVYGVKSPQEK